MRRLLFASEGRTAQAIRVVLAMVAYAATALAGMQFSVLPPGYASPMWPAAGVAVGAALFWRGPGLIGIALGSMVANAVTQQGFDPSHLVVGLGAAVQAALARWLVIWRVNHRLYLQRIDAVWQFALIVGPLASVVNGVVGPLALLLGSEIPRGTLLAHMATWWTGDTLGAVVVAPIMLALLHPSTEWSYRRRYVLPMQLILLGVTAATFLLMRDVAVPILSPQSIWYVGACMATALAAVSTHMLALSIRTADHAWEAS